MSSLTFIFQQKKWVIYPSYFLYLCSYATSWPLEVEALHCEIIKLWAQHKWGPQKRHQAIHWEPLLAMSAIQIQAISKLMNIGQNNSHSTSIFLQDGRSRYPEFIPLISTCLPWQWATPATDGALSGEITTSTPRRSSETCLSLCHHAGTCHVHHPASNLLKYMKTLPVGFCKRPCSSLPCLQALLRMCEDANTSWEGHLSWLLPEPSPADCIIIHDSQSQPRTQWCCATLTGGIPKEVPRDGAWLNSQESLSLSLPLSNSGVDAYTLWLLTGIAHCHAHHSLQAQQRIATATALSLSLPLSPPLPDKTPPLHLSVTPFLLHIICTSLPPSWSRR